MLQRRENMPKLQIGNMLQSIDLTTMLLLFLLGIAIAMLGEAFQQFMKPGQIFNWWAIWLEKMVEKATETRQIKDYKGWCDGKWKYKSGPQIWYVKLIAKLAKPLGLCPYCNSTWLAIIFFVIYFGINWNIFLLIGMVWFFIYLIEKSKNKK